MLFDERHHRDRMLNSLKLLGTDELEDMIKVDDGAEAVCHFCNEKYQPTSERLRSLIDEMKLEQASR